MVGNCSLLEGRAFSSELKLAANAAFFAASSRSVLTVFEPFIPGKALVTLPYLSTVTSTTTIPDSFPGKVGLGNERALRPDRLYEIPLPAPPPSPYWLAPGVPSGLP